MKEANAKAILMEIEAKAKVKEAEARSRVAEAEAKAKEAESKIMSEENAIMLTDLDTIDDPDHGASVARRHQTIWARDG